VSCSREAEYSYSKNTAYIKAHNVAISDMRVIKWRVGKFGKDILSRGFRLSFELPLLSDEALKVLYEKKNIDSWLIRLKRKQGLHSEILGYYSMTMISPDPRHSSRLRFRSPKKASIGINYAASSISMRLSELPCPALNHRLLIDDYEVKNKGTNKQSWVVSGVDDYYVSPKVTMISYSPITVNGGMKLKGDYSVELAFYNQKLKRRLSSFVTLMNIASVEKEAEVTVKGCENYIVPNREEGEGNPVQRFKFSR